MTNISLENIENENISEFPRLLFYRNSRIKYLYNFNLSW